MRRIHLAVAAAMSMTMMGAAHANDQISIVGSSTVYPFAHHCGRKVWPVQRRKTPVIESTGTGGGMKLFCKGIGVEHPDITNVTGDEVFRGGSL